MKYTIYSLAMILLCVGTHLTAQDNDRVRMDPPTQKSKFQVDSLVQHEIGNELSKFIASTKSIEIYEVSKFVVNDSARADLIEGFPILNTEVLTDIQAAAIKKLLTSKDTYLWENRVKQCFFLPRMALRFNHQQRQANVLVSFDCNMVRFYFDNKFYTLNSDNGAEDLVLFFESVFDNNAMSMTHQEEIVAQADDLNAEQENILKQDLVNDPQQPQTCVEKLATENSQHNTPKEGTNANVLVIKKVNHQVKERNIAIQYKVKKNDSWAKLAEEYNLTLQRLCELNNFTEQNVLARKHDLQEGQVIIIGFKTINN